MAPQPAQPQPAWRQAAWWRRWRCAAGPTSCSAPTRNCRARRAPIALTGRRGQLAGDGENRGGTFIPNPLQILDNRDPERQQQGVF